MTKPSSFYIHGRIKFGITGDVDGCCYPFKSVIETITPQIQEVLYKHHQIAVEKKKERSECRKSESQLARRKRERGGK